MNKILKIFICLTILSNSGSLYAIDPFDESSDVIISNSQNQSKEEIVETAKIISVSEETKEENEPNKEEISIDGVIKVDGSLRLREYPWGPVLGIYSNDTKCTIIGEEEDFYKVNINGSIGYLHKNYVSTDSKPASGVEPNYPKGCRQGGYIARKQTSTETPISTKTSTNTSTKTSTKTSTSTSTKTSTDTSSTVISKTSVIGKKQGDGTAAGAVTWAKDQMAGGTQKGCNNNTGKNSSDPTCWNYWCGAFVSAAWGRSVPQMFASSAYGQYLNFKEAGMIHTDKNPPAGAIMFTGKTATNDYGHVFLATGEVDSNGDPIVITSGWAGHNGITTMSLTKMIGSAPYLGWAMPE